MGLEVRFSFCDYREKRIHSEQNLSFDKEEIDGKTLLQSVADTLKTSPDDIDLFFAGRLIQSSSDFLLKDKTGFESGSKIQVFYKPIEPKTEDTVSVDQGELKMCMAGLHLMLNNKHQRWKSRKAVLGILKSKESLAEIINSIPSLKSDTLSLDILKNPDLFASVVDPKNCNNIMELHRPLAAAMIALSHKVSLSTSSSGSQVEMAMDVDGSPGTSQSTRRSNRPNPNLSTPRGQSIITSSQLATALSMANSPAIFPSPIGTPASLQSPLPVTPSSGSGSAATSSQGVPGMLTPDVFSQAMQQALSQSSSPGASGGESQPAAGGPPAQLPESVIKEGLEQLRSMGIQDEQASRQALVVAGGNVQAAVNILFASGMEDL